MDQKQLAVQFLRRIHTLVLGVVFFAASFTGFANDDLKDIAIKFRDATSFYLLAQKYAIGGGTNRDYQEAIKWYTEAAKLGHAKSELQLGRFYFEGLGTDVADAVMPGALLQFFESLIPHIGGQDFTLQLHQIHEMKCLPAGACTAIPPVLVPCRSAHETNAL